MKNTQKPYHVHFVCHGNTYRSRLAAAYFESLIDKSFAVSSSGINAARTQVKTSEKYTQATAKAHGLSFGITDHNTQTTDALLQDADVLVFMNRDVYDEAFKTYQFDVRKCLVWHVPDITPAFKTEILAKHSDAALVDGVAGTFRNIQKRCTDLHKYLTGTAWLDVVDADDKPIGLRLPMAWVTDRGLWHRGIHVVVQTHDGKFVVGKRDNSIVFAPGMLEISLGGGVDTGEDPLRAAVRETHEEFGILLDRSKFRPLFIYKQIGTHRKYNKQTKVHLYVYAVTLPAEVKGFIPQEGEVAEIRVLSRRQIVHVLRTHRMEHFGRLKWGYKLYQKAVAYSTLPQ